MFTDPVFDKFILRESYFDHSSQLHGLGHTYRVMCHVVMILQNINRNELMFPSLFAAFVHDMARKHDGFCTEHGKWAADKKVPFMLKELNHLYLNPAEVEQVKIAIEYHSLPDELPRHHNAYLITAVLKDADALDRIRLGDNNLDKRFLRFKETLQLIHFAKRLYLSTVKRNFSSFTDALKHAYLINQNN